MREGLKIVAARGVTAVHDKDGWLGAPRFWQRLADEEALTLRVWQSLPYDHVERARGDRAPRRASATTCCGSAT